MLTAGRLRAGIGWWEILYVCVCACVLCCVVHMGSCKSFRGLGWVGEEIGPADNSEVSISVGRRCRVGRPSFFVNIGDKLVIFVCFCVAGKEDRVDNDLSGNQSIFNRRQPAIISTSNHSNDNKQGKYCRQTI